MRERVGSTDEEVDLPAGVATVADLVRWLKDRGEEYAYAFENEDAGAGRHRPHAM